MTSTPSNTKPSNCLAGLRQATRWREERAAEIFPTASSFEWFKRQHRAELLGAGVLIPSRGRRGDLVTPEIDGVVLGILRREAGL
ncbi:hypothetical protein MASR1M60_30740 [Rhodocyclaceae bacterium]